MVRNVTVTLYDGKEQVIASAPVGDVLAHRARFPAQGLQINIDGTRYTLDTARRPW